jgi:glycosyltransferase involved in cell wall biosynthesis
VRVVHVITRLIVGGAQENTVASVLGLRREPDMDVTLISGPALGPEGSLESCFDGMRGCLSIFPSLVRPVSPCRDVAALLKLWRRFRRDVPDLVHTHSGKAGILGRLAARWAGVRMVVHTIHGPSFGRFQGPVSNALFRGAEVAAGRATDHFVAVSHAMTRQYLAAGIGTPAQFTRILSGFDLKPFLEARNDPIVRAELGLQPDDIIVGTIARLFELKGHDDLLDCAVALVRQCPRIRLLWVGDGAWRARLEARARALGLGDRVVFAGLVPPAKVAALVGIMDLVVHLSRREGLPRALPQAMAAGKPVVACDCDGANEVCLDDQTGFLVQPGDIDTLQRRILALARDPSLCARLGDAGRQFVGPLFGEERMVEELHELYLRLASQSGQLDAPHPPLHPSRA